MKRFFAIGLIVAMSAMALSVFAVLPVDAASAGDLIKMDGNPAVYYLGSDDKRYVFPNAQAYFTWYEDFSGVVTVSQSELESYSIGGNVTYRAGTYMVKITTDPKTYAVEPGGVLRWVTTEAIATSLYGAEWWLKIQDVPDPFFVNYDSSGADITDATYPDGVLVSETGGTTTYYIEDGTKRPIADETAFNANNFNWDYVLTTSSLSSYTDGTSITGYIEAIATVAGPGTPEPTPASEGTLTISLASDTPASTTMVENAMWVKYTKFNLTATGGDVIVDSMQIKRLGLAQDSNFSNVYLVDGDTNEIHGSEKTLSSNHAAYVTKDLTIANGTTKTMYTAATMGGTMLAGEMASLAISEVNVKGNASVSGTLPITGNEMTMNGTIAIGTVTISNPALATTATKPVGTTDHTFASIKLAVNSTEDFQVEKIVFYQSGTAADADIANLDLVLEGNVLGTVSEPNDKYVSFDLSSSPYTITKGQNKSFELRGDIVDGSLRTINFDIYNKADILVKGKTYGFYRLLSGLGASAPYYDMAQTITVSTGTLTVSKAVASTTNISESATQQELGAFYFNAEGEPIIVTQVVMEVNTSTTAGELSNLTIYDEDGGIVAGPQDKVDGTPDTVTFTDTFTVPTGIHTYTVKGDLDSGWAASDWVRLDFAAGPDADVTAKGDVTGNAVTPSPTSEIEGGVATVKIGDLNITTSGSPAAQTVAAGTSNYVFANFVLDATQSGEDIKVTQLQVKHTTSAANIHNYITGITLYDGSTALNTPKSGESGTAASTATSTITLTNPLIITKGTAKTIVLKGDISGSAADASTHAFGMVGDTTTGCATVYGNTSGNSIDEDITNSDGQSQTITTAGELRMANAGTNPITGLVLADSTNEVGVFNLQARYENIEIEKFGFSITDDKYINVDWLDLYDGAILLGSIRVTGNNATITPASFTIDQNSTEVLTLKARTHKVGVDDTGTSADDFAVTLTGMDAKGVSTGSTSVTKTGLDTTKTNTHYIFKTIPTVTKVNLSGMANGTQDLFKFTITADSKGELGFYKATFAITTTSATVTNFSLFEISGTSETDLSSTDLAATEELTDETNNTGGKYGIQAVIDTAAMDGIKERRTIGMGSTVTYVLRGDVTGWDTNASIQVQLIGDNAAPVVENTDNVDDDASENFIWSDLNWGYNTSSATATKQWVNGYKVFATTTQVF